MIPMYNEDASILYETVEAIALSDYDLTKIAITIHGEAARSDCYDATMEKCQTLADKFGYFGSTLHVLQP
jgi:cellulose synthase/poly-beta-1,6-N-acetylglucosamine synthase-like glycosyltransferase